MEEKTEGEKRGRQGLTKRTRNNTFLAYYVFSIQNNYIVITPKQLTEYYTLAVLLPFNSHANEVSTIQANLIT